MMGFQNLQMALTIHKVKPWPNKNTVPLFKLQACNLMWPYQAKSNGSASSINTPMK
jgi:hypothetical protein